MAIQRIASQQQLTPAQFDFYTYTQLNATLEKVFFPTNNEAVQALSFWGVYAAGFVVRPIGALIFGHIGDTKGRNRCLLISICCMAFATIAIGVLPTYSVAPYAAGVAAPVLLALCRILQGMAMGGEFGSAVIYISELAPKDRRGAFVATLQMSVNIGMMLATILVMLLQNTLTPDAMLAWGWRVPFLCAFTTALLGAALRSTMPEPKAFLTAARLAKLRAEADSDGDVASKDAGAHPPSAKDLDIEVATEAGTTKGDGEVDGDEGDRSGALAKLEEISERLHGHSDAKTPIVRLLRNNALGVFLNICYMAISGAFYVTVSWLAKDLRTYGYSLIVTQGILIVSLVPNALGLLTGGKLIDAGVPAIQLNAATVVIGTGLGFAVYPCVGYSVAHAWGLVSMFQYIIGIAMANVGMPCTRIYEPLSRTTGFSFSYNCGYGIIGGLSPLAVAAIKANLPGHAFTFAPAIWLACLGGISIAGVIGLTIYQPRLAKPHVGKIE
ncbi:Alpha-ketoglutarate permease [Monoraphidium neglectum]|uniref:Alpha-ketoglutarate permease n=1 Tax=Monoraphidium neglectum TaxID=145388 RepID=A0A0D2KCV0_9CHLO|nr:Alpha-ketoglutarate permease [Monoraphidium neglectum]KIZ07913.1 Alpha-ketoglutarate permease [Monoraphidium neglectum]|eukprot:XP_013906932.1 Alpha-ketoglutarate permease [Monoraphidium neglectum]